MRDINSGEYSEHGPYANDQGGEVGVAAVFYGRAFAATVALAGVVYTIGVFRGWFPSPAEIFSPQGPADVPVDPTTTLPPGQ